MNPFVDFLFTISWFILLVWAIRTMARGWGLMTQPIERTPSGVWTTQVKKPVHPEMIDVKPGQELMGVTFNNQSNDPLLESLQERIDEIEEEEDDDGGDVIVRV